MEFSMSNEPQQAVAPNVKLTSDDYLATKLDVTADFLPFASLALQRYGKSLLRSISLQNNGEEEINDLALKFVANPALFTPKTFYASSVKGGETIVFDSNNGSCPSEFLSGLSFS